MSCLGLLVHAVRRTLPVLPYVCPHTSVVPLPHRLWGAGHCPGTDPWHSAGPPLPHPQGIASFRALLKFYSKFSRDCCAGIIAAGWYRHKHVSQSSLVNSLPSCFSFTDAAFQENWLRTQNHLYLAMDWDCKAKDTATIGLLTSDRELAKIKAKSAAKRVTIF